MPSLIEELQRHALDPSISVEDLLRKAWVAAEKLGLTEFSAWAKKELDGYDPSDVIPPYRRVHSEFQAYNPYHGWQPIIWSNAKNAEVLFEPREITTGAGLLQKTVDDDDLQALFLLPPKLKAQIVAMLEFPTDVRCLLNKSELREIVGHARNEVLRWSMELERAGVVGEGLSFSKQEKEKAQSVEFHFHGVQNVSNVLGDVGDGGSVSINQQASGIDPLALADLASQLRENLEALVPPNGRRDFAQEIKVIEVEAAAAMPDAGKIRRALTVAGGMIRAAGKGAATSLMAQGALTLIEAALKHL